ncbi:hypothetical protein [Streptomyces hydrogenans]|uniref:hypothetical protein n=1 Tax=Streptomyces hydrogenans TaxID=1873719 RepID=UPI0036E21B0D
MTWIPALLTTLYLAGVATLTAALPLAIRRQPEWQLVSQVAPVAVCLYLAIVTVAWPGIPLLAALSRLTRRTR